MGEQNELGTTTTTIVASERRRAAMHRLLREAARDTPRVTTDGPAATGQPSVAMPQSEAAACP
ncbi:MAG TPA: hypothetical protein VH561_05170 [Micromonosporaceae bacterium]|jgi:hypothetical protein